jgi:hypothetical protein
MSKALRIEPDIGLQELLEIAVSTDWSVQFSPLLRGPGGRQGGTFVRSAAPVKGVTKNDNESYNEYTSRLEEGGHDGVARGLEALRDMRQSVGGLDNEEGVVLINKNGDVYPVPRSAAIMAREAGNASFEGEYNDVNEALGDLRSKTGETAALPSAY